MMIRARIAAAFFFVMTPPSAAGNQQIDVELQKLLVRDPFGFGVALQDALVAEGELQHAGNIEAARAR